MERSYENVNREVSLEVITGPAWSIMPLEDINEDRREIMVSAQGHSSVVGT